MEDLQYFLSMGFSGSDVGQAFWIGLLISLLISRLLRPMSAVFLAFIIDRLMPFWGMHGAGYERDVIWSAMIGVFSRIPQDMMYYIIRYIGIAIIVLAGYKLRLMLHRALGSEHDGRIFSHRIKA